MTESNLPAPEILYERGAVLVLRKPGGLLTQAPPGIDSLELRTKQFLIARENKPGKAYLGVPHRLDRPVSGVIVVTKNVRAANRISEQFENRSVTKRYWAVVEGIVQPKSGEWTDFMRKLPDEAKSEIVVADHADAKQAILNFTVIGCGDGMSWLEIELQTGRTHQIRLQCSAHGHPIVGDETYGASSTFGQESLDIRKRLIALHARRLRFEHPTEAIPVDVTANLSNDWRQFACFSDAMFDQTE